MKLRDSPESCLLCQNSMCSCDTHPQVSAPLVYKLDDPPITSNLCLPDEYHIRTCHPGLNITCQSSLYPQRVGSWRGRYHGQIQYHGRLFTILGRVQSVAYWPRCSLCHHSVQPNSALNYWTPQCHRHRPAHLFRVGPAKGDGGPM